MKSKTILTALLGTKTANEPTGCLNNRLPEKFYKLSAIATVLSLILTAYTTASASAYTSEIPGQNNPATTEVTPTATESAEKPAEADTIQQMAIDYIDDKREIDFDKLSNEEYEEISVAITEELNNRIESPIYTPENGQITYFDNKTGQPSTMSTSEFDQKKAELAPNPYIPAKKDADGTWMYLDEETKQYVRIEGSAGFDLSSVVDENNMVAGIIKWPTTEKYSSNPKYTGPYPDLTYPEMFLKNTDWYGGLYVPAILTSKQYIKIPVYGRNGVRTYSKAFTFLVKKAYGFEKIYVPFVGSSLEIYEENSSVYDQIQFNLENDGTTKHMKELIINQICFLGFSTKQAQHLDTGNKIKLDNVEGVVSVEDNLATVADEQSKENKLLFIVASLLIKHQ